MTSERRKPRQRRGRGRPSLIWHWRLTPLIDELRASGHTWDKALMLVAEEAHLVWELVTWESRKTFTYPTLERRAARGDDAARYELDRLRMGFPMPYYIFRRSCLPLGMMERLPALTRAQLRSLWGGQLPPPPTYHSKYPQATLGDQGCAVAIGALLGLAGGIPPAALALIVLVTRHTANYDFGFPRFAPNMAAYGAAPKGDVILITHLRASAPPALRARWRRGELRISRVRHGANEKSNLRACPVVDSGECGWRTELPIQKSLLACFPTAARVFATFADKSQSFEGLK